MSVAPLHRSLLAFGAGTWFTTQRDEFGVALCVLLLLALVAVRGRA